MRLRPRPRDVPMLGAQPGHHPGHGLTPAHRRIGARCRVGFRGLQQVAGRDPGVRMIGPRHGQSLRERPLGFGEAAQVLSPGFRPHRRHRDGGRSGDRVGMSVDPPGCAGDVAVGEDACEEVVAARQGGHRLGQQRIRQRLPPPRFIVASSRTVSVPDTRATTPTLSRPRMRPPLRSAHNSMHETTVVLSLTGKFQAGRSARIYVARLLSAAPAGHSPTSPPALSSLS